MSNETVKNELKKCTKYSDKIIQIISKNLDERQISHKVKNDSEIIIKNIKKNDIIKILDEIDISNDIIKILVNVSSVNNNVYVRRKFSRS